MTDRYASEDWELTRAELQERRRIEREAETHLTVTHTDELDRVRSAALWPTLCRLFGLKEKGAGIGDPVLVWGAGVEIHRIRQDAIQVTIPVTVTLIGDSATGFLAAVDEAARR